MRWLDQMSWDWEAWGASRQKGKCLSSNGRTIRAAEGTGDSVSGSGTNLQTLSIPNGSQKHICLNKAQMPGANQIWAGHTCSGILEWPRLLREDASSGSLYTGTTKVIHDLPTWPWQSKDWLKAKRFFRKHAEILLCLCFDGGYSLKGEKEEQKQNLKSTK